MAKRSTVFICRQCSHQEPRWLGRCPACGTWNSLAEEAAPAAARPGRSAGGFGAGGAGSGPGGSGNRPRALSLPLAAVETSTSTRLDTGSAEVNQVLGGGLLPGAAVLLGGEPGIGKSTLVLQVAARLKSPGRVLYISGEESAAQLKLRADRLGLARDGLEVLVETQVELILGVLEKVKPVLVIADSIQTLWSPDAGDVPGTVNQLKFATHELIDWCKERGTAVWLIAHVTKGGAIAGPKLVEHMVDTVLMFEEASADLRILRAVKNRFGSVDEVGLFGMEERGLVERTNPRDLFLVQRPDGLPPGVAVAPVLEGSRVLCVEIQALCVPAKAGLSRISSDRIDSARVSRLAAVIEKHLGLRFTDQDLFVNVAGGLRLTETAIDLPLAAALISARTGLAVPDAVVLAGELSLAGEVRPIPHLKRRFKAAADLGFTRALGPADPREPKPSWTALSKLSQTVKQLWDSFKKPD